MSVAKIRLFVEHPLAEGQTIQLNSDQAHYLFGVMRLNLGHQVLIFNGTQGEWAAEISEIGKRKGQLVCLKQTKPQSQPEDIWLVFSPLKKARTDMLVEKAVELGAARIVPALTQFTNAERVRTDRMQARIVEAAEQCGATYLPEIAAPTKLNALLNDWPSERAIVFCDEKAAGESTRELPQAPVAIFIGPEGGFSDAERNRLESMDKVYRLALGPRILRAETAALAALTLWQAHEGDW